MAGNKGTIDEIVDPAAMAQVKELISLLVNAKGELIATAKGAKDFTNAIGDVKTIKDFEAATAKASIQMSNMSAAADKASIISLKKSQLEQKIADDTIKRLLKEEQAQNSKTKTIVSNSQSEVTAYQKSTTGLGKLGNVTNDYDKKAADAANKATALASAVNATVV